MLARRAIVATLTLLLLGASCGGSERYVPGPDRGQGLPESPKELIARADAILAESPREPARVDRAVAALEKALEQDPADRYAVLWRLARARFEMTQVLSVKEQRQSWAAKGCEAGRAAVEANPEPVEGHYYLALNLARKVQLAQATDRLKEVLERASRARERDAAYDAAGPLRLMAKIYMAAPEWPNGPGDREKAVELMKKAVSKAPTPLNRLFLGEAYYHADQHEQAKPQLRRALEQGREEGLEARWRDEARSYLRRLGESP